MSKIKLGAKDLKAAIAEQMSNNMKPPLPEVRPNDVDHATASIRLRVMDVQFYDHNPRTVKNEKYQELKDSVIATGIQQAMYVTKRPGATQWMMAKGANTRLEILQDLWTTTGDKQWEYHDFLIKPYVKESELIAAHLVENIQRSDMSFWDTAKGLLLMRGEMQKEIGGSLSPKKFTEKLKETGLSFSERTLSYYIFAVEKFSMLGEFAHQITLAHIVQVFSPQYNDLKTLVTKKDGVDDEGFDAIYGLWVDSYPSEHSVYDVATLQRHIHGHASQFLDVGDQELSLMLEASKLNPKASLEELRTPPPPPPGGFGSDGDGDGNEDSDQKSSKTPQGSVSTDQGLANLAATLQGQGNAPFAVGDTQGAASGIKGLKVASGLVPKSALSDQSPDDGFVPGVQHPLDGLSPLDSAREQLKASLYEFAEIAGITAQMLPAPGMPLGYYMELPKAGVLGTSAELPLQAWWFLANLAGQVEADFDSTLNRLDDGGALALPDTGPGGFRHALADDTEWGAAVHTRLGGEPLIVASHVFAIVTDAQHPLCEPAMQLFAHIRTLRMYEAEMQRSAK